MIGSQIEVMSELWKWRVMGMNSSWNKAVYRMWAPVYDIFFNTGVFRKAGVEVFKDLTFLPG